MIRWARIGGIGFFAWGVTVAPAAGFEEGGRSARSAALGESTVAAPDGPDSLTVNPALLAFDPRPAVSLSAGRLFGLTEFSEGTLSASRGGGGAVWGLSLSEFGSALYREREWVVGAGRVLAPGRASLGGTVKYQETSVARYGRSGVFGADVGFLGRPAPGWGAGVSLRQVFSTQTGGSDSEPRATLAVGASRAFGAKALTALTFVRDGGGASAWRLGQELSPVPVLSLRLGAESATHRFSMGFGLRQGAWALDYAFVAHPVLPGQHRVTLVWRRAG